MLVSLCLQKEGEIKVQYLRFFSTVKPARFIYFTGENNYSDTGGYHANNLHVTMPMIVVYSVLPLNSKEL